MPNNFIFKIENFIIYLFVFVLIVDPGNQLFRIKDIIFVFLIAFLLIFNKRIRLDFLIAIVIIYCVIIMTYLRGILCSYSFDSDFTIYIFKTFTPLFLLLWINKLELLEKMILPSLVVSIITIVVTIIFLFYPEFVTVTYNYLVNDKQLLGMSTRQFLGIEFSSVYYRSLSLLIIPSTIYFYRWLFDVSSNKRKYILISILLYVALFLGGTRACILSAVVSIVTICFLKLKKNRMGKILAPLIMIGSLVCLLMIIFLLLSDSQETSNEVKFGHLESYKILFQENPIIILFGSGAGSLFYSLGTGVLTAQTEWTYVEFIRMFGIIGTCIILSLYFLPLVLLYQKRTILKYWLPFLLGYLLFLLIAGTNPYLIGSNGMLAILVLYSYVLNPKYEYNITI